MKTALPLLSFLMLLLVGCHPRPVADIALADVALKAAQKVKADAMAPDAYRRAENFFLRAKKDFADGYFDSSRKFANQARMMAEQAEFKALQKQSQMKNRPAEDEGAGPQAGGPPGMGGGIPPGMGPPGMGGGMPPGMGPGGPPGMGGGMPPGWDLVVPVAVVLLVARLLRGPNEKRWRVEFSSSPAFASVIERRRMPDEG